MADNGALPAVVGRDSFDLSFCFAFSRQAGQHFAALFLPAACASSSLSLLADKHPCARPFLPLLNRRKRNARLAGNDFTPKRTETPHNAH